MPKKLFIVTIAGDDGGSEESYMVHAMSERAAAMQARKFALIPRSRPISLKVELSFAGCPVGRSSVPGLPPQCAVIEQSWSGWIVNAMSPDGRILVRQYLVAIENSTEALQAVVGFANPLHIVSLGAAVDSGHFSRRKMKRGEMFQLGVERVTRGKNVKI